MNLCSYCSRNYICGNQITKNYCTGFIKMKDTTWVDKLYDKPTHTIDYKMEWLKQPHREE